MRMEDSISAVHDGHGFNSENLQWFVDMIDVFRE